MEHQTVHIESPKHLEDRNLAKRLACGDGVAWSKFQKELHGKVYSFIETKYPDILGDTHKEEICLGVVKRLEANDYRVLHDFRAECSLASYVSRQVEWEILDWLKRNSDRLYEESIDPEREASALVPEAGYDRHSISRQKHEECMPEAVLSLKDELRWAFLLRHYDDFGFPASEIRLLAKKRSVPVLTITNLIIRYMEEDETGAIVRESDRRSKLSDRLHTICHALRRFDVTERLLQHPVADADAVRRSQRLTEMRRHRQRLEKRRQDIRNELREPVTTSYRVIADILGEESEETVRSRVFYAKKRLKEILRNNGEI